MIDDMIAVRHVLPGRTIKVYAIADVHLGDALCDLDGVRKLCAEIKRDENAYCVLCGDIFNNAIRDSVSDIYSEQLFPQQQLDLGIELFKPIADKILGVVGGNHEKRTQRQTGIDMTAVFCELLGIGERYRENMCFVMVSLRNGRIMHSYNLLLMHGKSENKKKQFAYAIENIDALITGHTHSGIIEKPARLALSDSGVAHVHELVSITATSWLKYGGYGAAAMFKPVATSSPQYLILHYFNSNDSKNKISVVW